MSDLSKEQLYEGVKSLVEQEARFIHLPQPKLYTLSSLSFQFFLYNSTKRKGSYLIRVEDGFLAEKLAKKSKDESSRKFLTKLLNTRKLTFNQATFYLDYFHPQSWPITQHIPLHNWQGALVIKGTGTKTFIDNGVDPEADHAQGVLSPIDENIYLMPLTKFQPKIIYVSFNSQTPPEFKLHKFSFIPDKEEDELHEDVSLHEEIKNMPWDNS